MARGQLDTVLRHLRALLVSKTAAHLADADLLRRFVERRDETAFTVLVRRHGGLVLHVCRTVLHQEADAEDAFQATFLVLARKAASFRKGASLASWLHGVAFRSAMNLRKSAMRRHQREQAAAAGRSPESPVSQAALNELQSYLHEEIERLSEKHHAAFILCCLEGKSRADAAQALGCTEGTLASRLAKARELLQNRLTARGVSLSAALSAVALSQSVTTASVSASLADATTQAALAFTAGNAAGAVSSQVLALAQGVLQGMLITKLKIGAVLTMAVCLSVSAAGGFVTQSGAGDKLAGQIDPPNPPPRIAIDKPELKDRKKLRIDAFGDPLPDGAIARLGTQRFRHEGNATFLRYTPDGKSLIGVTFGGIIVWDAETGKVRNRIHRTRNPNEHSGFDVSPDGSVIAMREHWAKEDDGKPVIGLWDVKSGQKVRTFTLPDEHRRGQFAHFRFASDGKSLALSYDAQGRSVIIDIESGKVRASLGDPNSFSLYGLTISPDNKFGAAGACSQPNPVGINHRLEIWDLATQKLIRVAHELPATETHLIGDIAFSPDGKKLAFGAGSKIYVYDPETGKELNQLEEKSGCKIAFTRDSRKLIVGGSQGKVRIWDLQADQIVRVLETRTIGSMALSPDSSFVALGDYGHSLQFFNLATGNELFTEYQGHESQINDLAFSPNGKTLVSAGSYGRTLVWNMGWQRIDTLQVKNADKLAISPDSRQLAITANYDADVRIWNFAAEKETQSITLPDNWRASSATYSPDGQKLFILECKNSASGNRHYRVQHWDIPAEKRGELWEIDHVLSYASLASDGKTLCAGVPFPGGVTVLDVQTGRKRFEGGRTVQWIHPTLSADGALIASALRSPTQATVQIWEVASGAEIYRLQGHGGLLSAIAWSNNGRRIATGDANYTNVSGSPLGHVTSPTVRLWDTVTGKELACFKDFNADVTALAFSPDARSLVTGLRDGTMLVFDVEKYNRPPLPGKLADAGLESLWSDLADADAVMAHRAGWSFVDGGEKSTRFLHDRLKPIPIADAGKIQKWIGELGSDTFTVRDAASKELLKIGEQVQVPIQKALSGDLPLESRRRLKQVLETVTANPSPETVRTIRAIMVLERIRSPEAQSVLAALARGAPGDRVTEEAGAVLNRLAKFISQSLEQR